MISPFVRFVAVSMCLAGPALLALGEEPAVRRVAVAPLSNLRGDTSIDWIGSGASETLTTKLAGIKGLLMIERSQVSRVMGEQDIKLTQTDNAAAACKLGKIVSADRIVVGSFVKAGAEILFNVRVVDVESGVVLNTATVKTSEAKIFDAMFELAEAVVLSFDKKVVVVNKVATAAEAPAAERLELSAEQKQLLKEIGSTNWEAGQAWSKAVDLVLSDPRGAVRLSAQAIQLDPQFAAAYVCRARAYFTMSSFDKALVDVNKAIKLSPHEAENFSLRGQIYMKLGVNDKAFSDFNKALEINNQSVSAYCVRAILYATLNRLEEAMADANRAVKLNPGWSENYRCRAVILALSGNIKEAMDDANHAIELAPNIANGYFSRGIVYRRAKQNDKAVADYTKAIELDSFMAEAYCNRANIRYMQDEYAKAIADYTQAIEISPLYVDALVSRGLCYYNQNNYNAALADWDKALELNDQNGEIYSYRVRANYMLGRKAAAWADVERAEKLGATIPDEVKQALKN